MQGEPDRVKLAKLLGMLGSDHAGERAAAALMADRLVRGAGLTWPAVLAVPAAEQPDPAKRPQADVLAEVQARAELLTVWERDFLAGLAGYTMPTAKQRALLDRLAAKVRMARAGGGAT